MLDQVIRREDLASLDVWRLVPKKRNFIIVDKGGFFIDKIVLSTRIQIIRLKIVLIISWARLGVGQQGLKITRGLWYWE